MSATSLSSIFLPVMGTIILWLFFRTHNTRQRLPPGPAGVPLLGNIHQIPTKLTYIYFAESSKKYGPVVSFMAGTQPVVVLHTHEAAFELFEKRSSNYSHRSKLIMANDLLCGGLLLPLISYDSLFRRMKRTTQATFSPRATEQFQLLQEIEATHLMKNLLNDPRAWNHSLESSISSAILTAVYGWPRLTEEHGPILRRIHDHINHISKACTPGSSMVDIIPVINRLPLWMSKWKRDALAWHERETEMFEGFYREVENKMHDGRATESFTRSMIENKAVNDLSVKEASWLSGIMFNAGADTTIASMKNFLIAMLYHPHVMRKAQAELDRVVGRDRLPAFKDHDYLPYVRAIVKEVLRLHPTGPLGVPRRTAEDDWYNGYFIPKDTIVISNIWAINRDPAIYQDPDEFMPERHLGDDGSTEVSPPRMHSLGHCTFGFGRRSCIGMTFANQSLFINFAFLLWAFDIKKGRNAAGEEICPSLTDVIDSGISVGPAPFECELVPRHPDVRAVVLRSLT